MRKCRNIIVILIFIYVGMALSVYIYVSNDNVSMSKQYRIEINRIQNRLENMKSLSSKNIILLTDNTRYVREVRYCSIKDINSDFFNTFNDYYTQINVIKDDKGHISGYVKYIYTADVKNNHQLFIIELYLLAAFAVCIGIIIYVYRHIIGPFNTLSEMPYELSRGNLQDEIKENRNRYFGKFVWGISMLKDNLEGHKRNEYKLAHDKKMLVLSISHDIKTPLNAINLYATALENDIYTTKEEQRNSLKMIREKTAEIDGFVKEIVQTQTENVVAIDVNISEFYLSELVDKVRLGYAEKCKIRQIDFVIDKYEDHLICGDKDRLYEAIGNLMENAIKYGDGKEIKITFSEEDYCQLISVYNSGECVGENETAHLFDSFFRGTNTKGKAGNGLGLYICSQIMHKMNGDIYAKRRENGMEFVLVCEMN